MRWSNRIIVVLGAACLSCSLEAVPAESLRENYQSIIERNPFGLKPPPPPPTNVVEQVKEKPKVEIFLTGLTAIDYPRMPKQAYLYTREHGKKDVTYYTLTEGNVTDGIEVLSIDAEKRRVRVRMDNRETVLSFATHGVPSPAAPKPGAVQPGQPIPRPGEPPPMPAAGGQPGTAIYDPNGQPAYQNAAATQAINQRYGITPNGGNTGLRQIPSRQMRGRRGAVEGGMAPGMNGVGDGMQQPQQPVDLAEDYLRINLNNAVREREGIPMPPIPQVQ